MHPCDDCQRTSLLLELLVSDGLMLPHGPQQTTQPIHICIACLHLFLLEHSGYNVPVEPLDMFLRGIARLPRKNVHDLQVNDILHLHAKVMIQRRIIQTSVPEDLGYLLGRDKVEYRAENVEREVEDIYEIYVEVLRRIGGYASEGEDTQTTATDA